VSYGGIVVEDLGVTGVNVTVFVAIYWVYCVAYAFGQYKFVSDKEGSLVSCFVVA
jgi:hypothetical protein